MTVQDRPLPPTACLDWSQRLKRGQVPFNRAALPLRTAKAKKFGQIFDMLRVGDVTGEPRTSELPNTAWIRDIGCAIWGDDTIREALICVSKKQSKSSFGSLLFLAAMLADKTPRQTWTVLAPSVQIATIAFNAIESAIEADETLAALCHIRSYTREIEHRKTGAILTVKAYEKSAATGLKGSVLIDESWLLGEKSSAEKTRSQIKGALASNPQAKIVHITTTSDSVPRGSWASLLEYAIKVRDGVIIDPSFLPVLYVPWEGCDPWTDESVWPKTVAVFSAYCRARVLPFCHCRGERRRGRSNRQR